MHKRLKVIAPEIVSSSITFDQNPKSRHLQWQGPACTEGYAARILIRDGAVCVDPFEEQKSYYFAYPWATVIDRKGIDNAVSDFLSWTKSDGQIMKGARVHTVCQSIHWTRILPVAKAIGLTDIHISHYTASSTKEASKFGIQVHSFPLIAACYFNMKSVEIEIPEVKPISKRRWVTGFNGNYMPHYRSDIRLRLEEQFKKIKLANSYFKLKRKWFYNDVIYQYQIKDRAIPHQLESELLSRITNFRNQLEDTVFSLCPEGAGPNTLRFWESLVAGAIPVIFENDWIPPESKTKIENLALIVPRRHIESTPDFILSYWESNKELLDQRSVEVREEVLNYAKLNFEYQIKLNKYDAKGKFP